MSRNPPLFPRRFSVPGDDDEGGSAYQYGRNYSQHGRPLLDLDEFHDFDVPHRNSDEGIDIKFNDRKPFDGIIAHLRRQYHENPARCGVVNITGNSFNPHYAHVLPHLFEPDWSGYWCSMNEPNSYVAVDFLEHRVKLTHYTIKTYNANAEWRHLKSWVAEGSNGGNWKEIHKIKRGSYLNGPFKVATFPVKNAAYYQIIRIRMIGPNHYGDYNLFLMGLEFFGVLD